ncbi:MAG: 4-hydroxy-tetrahydrodipicolinate reductase [Rhodospirillales bacterium]|jgi:4-hydroxy-tetrahydrodipicolinate reductase|nr:4-hydroxy-tetrahydrodipicolinate reductase [Rhodospirillales bacterium]
MKIGIVGCGGTMGRLLVKEVAAAEDCRLSGGSGRPGSPLIGRDVTEQAGLEPSGLIVTDDAGALFRDCDAVIDLSVAGAASHHAELAAAHGVALVHGTSGLDAAQQEAVEAAARHTAVVQSSSMSIGVNLMVELTEQTAAVLGEDYDIEIVELFHRNKVDAPSGTSLALGRAAAAGRGADLDALAVFQRDGEIGPRPAGAIGFAVLRGGDSPGEHTVIFAGAGERVEIAHKASSRSIYTQGAVAAARWAVGQPAGLYSMRDVLGLA